MAHPVDKLHLRQDISREDRFQRRNIALAEGPGHQRQPLVFTSMPNKPRRQKGPQSKVGERKSILVSSFRPMVLRWVKVSPRAT